MEFKEWVVQFKELDSPLGDLAYDVSRDKGFPETNDREKLLDYIGWRSRFDGDVIRAFKSAWRKYDRERV